MIQKCNVVYHNKFLNIVVFNFSGKEIQMTLDIPDGTKVVYIKYADNKYFAVSEKEYKDSLKVTVKAKNEKIVKSTINSK